MIAPKSANAASSWTVSTVAWPLEYFAVNNFGDPVQLIKFQNWNLQKKELLLFFFELFLGNLVAEVW
jgi:hypothetical protein